MTRRTSLRSRLAPLVYPLFYRLPHRVRMLLVRLVVPTYTVGSVVLVRDGSGSLLLLRQPPGRGWSLPAGLLARGESPVEGAARELAEESGIELRPDQLRPAVPNAMVHHRGRWVDMVFETEVPAATTVLRVDGAEVLEAQWHRLDDLPPLTGPTARLLGHYGIGPAAGEPGSADPPRAQPTGRPDAAPGAEVARG